MDATEPWGPIAIRRPWISRVLALQATASGLLRLHAGRTLSVVVGVGA